MLSPQTNVSWLYMPVFNDPNLDPARLCPWCDELLPLTPSPHLERLISIARARSSKDSRPTNPLGLYAAPTVFINVCQRHRFESHQVPLAQKREYLVEARADAKTTMREYEMSRRLSTQLLLGYSMRMGYAQRLITYTIDPEYQRELYSEVSGAR